MFKYNKQSSTNHDKIIHVVLCFWKQLSLFILFGTTNKYINYLFLIKPFFRYNIDNVISILDNFFKNGDNSTTTGHFENTDTEILKNGLLFLILFISFTTHCLITNCNSKFFIAFTNNPDKISSKSSSNEDGTEFKLEPDDFHDCIVGAADQIENNSDSSELSQNVDKFGENVAGSYY